MADWIDVYHERLEVIRRWFEMTGPVQNLQAEEIEMIRRLEDRRLFACLDRAVAAAQKTDRG